MGKLYIGIVKMKAYSCSSRKVGYAAGAYVNVKLGKDCCLAINSEQIVFNPNKLKISIPTLDSNKTYKICNKNKKFGFAHKTIPNEEFEGLYKMYKKEEYFILKKVKEI